MMITTMMTTMQPEDMLLRLRTPNTFRAWIAYHKHAIDAGDTAGRVECDMINRVGHVGCYTDGPLANLLNV